LAAQPAALTIAVSFTESVKPHLAVLRHDYNDAAAFLLGTAWKLGRRDNLRGVARKCSYRPMPWDFWLIFLFLGAVIPWRGRARLQRLLARPAIDTLDKLILYGSTIAFQWVALGVVAWRALARGLTPAQLGLAHHSTAGIVVAGLLGAALLGTFQWFNLRRIGRMTGPTPELMRKLAERILPTKPVELLSYCGLAVTAGVCEEFLYRGFAMAVLQRAGLPTTLVVILTAVFFGLAHAYQGRSGVMATAFMGILFGIGRLVFDSLAPMTVWHAGLDIVAGIAAPRFLLQKPRDTC
jgi:uncharacterized protein